MQIERKRTKEAVRTALELFDKQPNIEDYEGRIAALEMTIAEKDMQLKNEPELRKHLAYKQSSLDIMQQKVLSLWSIIIHLVGKICRRKLQASTSSWHSFKHKIIEFLVINCLKRLMAGHRAKCMAQFKLPVLDARISTSGVVAQLKVMLTCLKWIGLLGGA